MISSLEFYYYGAMDQTDVRLTHWPNQGWSLAQQPLGTDDLNKAYAFNCLE